MKVSGQTTLPKSKIAFDFASVPQNAWFSAAQNFWACGKCPCRCQKSAKFTISLKLWRSHNEKAGKKGEIGSTARTGRAD
ncbi:hypothetical protein RBSH_02091 [Rhodopirellula baltica SH28]|uniref:Uncharacterized protein n=1 Tax=Rhodopirellula baltica SH28 TaxID=993517 RepID=K5D6U8_RHOBT|nr:hypothetical protein RBSH_02091 [Rhodopirellula baltica SH28]